MSHMYQRVPEKPADTLVLFMAIVASSIQSAVSSVLHAKYYAARNWQV